MENKVWGKKQRLLETSTVVVDMLFLDKDSFCSWHYHDFKYNMFIVLEGEVSIELENDIKLIKKDESYIIDPKIKHRFLTRCKAKAIEVMYTKPVLEDDIIRSKQGGKIINDKYISEDELKQQDEEKGFNGMREKDYD